MTPDEARRVLVEELDWPAWMVDLGIRTDLRCEYCGRDLLADVDACDCWQKEHVVPDGNEEMSNLAIACRTCNFIKRNTDPRDTSTAHDRDSLVASAVAIVARARGAQAQDPATHAVGGGSADEPGRHGSVAIDRCAV